MAEPSGTAAKVAPHCDVHHSHEPTPLLFEQHHIQPLGMGGLDEPENKVWVCVQGHYNIHTLLADLIRHGQFTLRCGAHNEKDLALAGYTKWCEQGKPGHPVYETSWERPQA